MNHLQARQGWIMLVVAFSSAILLITALPFVIGGLRRTGIDPALGFGLSLATIVSGAVFTAKQFKEYLTAEPPQMLLAPHLFIGRSLQSFAFAEAGTLIGFVLLGIHRHPLFFVLPILSLGLIFGLVVPTGLRFFRYWDIQTGGLER